MRARASEREKMTALLEIKERLRHFYNRFEAFVNIALKFVMTLAALLVIGNKIGFMSTLKSFPMVLLISFVCAFLPESLIVVVVCAVMVAHLYSLSVYLAAIVLVVILIMLLLYFRFSPKDGIVLVLMPILFQLKIPYLIPICAGLISTPLSIVSISFGTILYYVMDYANLNSAAINNLSEEDVTTILTYIITNMLGNRELYLSIAAFAVVVLVVFIARKITVSYSWAIAVICGGVLNLIVYIIGILAFEVTTVSILVLVLGTIASMALACVFEYFFFSADYGRTENVQFEDDEYFYYVKAVPKLNIEKGEVNVKKINAGKAKKIRQIR